MRMTRMPGPLPPTAYASMTSLLPNRRTMPSSSWESFALQTRRPSSSRLAIASSSNSRPSPARSSMGLTSSFGRLCRFDTDSSYFKGTWRWVSSTHRQKEMCRRRLPSPGLELLELRRTARRAYNESPTDIPPRTSSISFRRRQIATFQLRCPHEYNLSALGNTPVQIFSSPKTPD